jgi:hypothetical protein
MVVCSGELWVERLTNDDDFEGCVAAHLMSDEWKSFVSIGQAFAAYDTVRHSDRQYVHSSVHKARQDILYTGAH